MQRFTRVCLALAIAGLMCASMAARAANEVLNLIPKDSEVVIGVNARQVIDSDIFKKIIETHPECKPRMEILQNLMGIDLMKDVDNLYLYGRINNKEQGGFIFKGHYDQQKVLTLIKANPKYASKTVDGQVYHTWYEEKEKRMKVGTMFPNGLTAVWNSEESAKASVAAMKDPAMSYASTPDAQLIPAGDDKAAAWIVVVNRGNADPLVKFRVASARANLMLGPNEVALHLTAVPQAAEDTPKWADLFRGVVAFGQLQNDKPPLRYLAGRTQVTPDADGKSVTVTISVETEKIMNELEKKAAK